MIVVKPLILLALLVGILGVAEVASTKRGKGRRFRQRPLAPAYHNNPISVAQPQIPSYRSFPSGYATPQALEQSPARPIAPRPGLVVFGVGPNSLQIPNHYSNYAGAHEQTKPIAPAPAYGSPTPAYATPAPVYASPTTVVNQTPPRNQPAIPNYAQPAHKQQNIQQTRYNSQPFQPTYPVPSSQYGNKLPEAQPENYQQPSVQGAVVPASAPIPKLPENIPLYVAPAKSTVYGSAYVGNLPSYPASDSYTGGEAYKPVESVPASYQSTAKKPQENYGTTATTSYNSKPTAIYIETKAKQSTEAYGKKTQVKESQSYYSTPSSKVKYSTDLPYSNTDSKPASDSYDKPYDKEKSKADKDQYTKPTYSASQSDKETETLSYGEKKKDINSLSLPYSKVEAKPVSQPSLQNEYKKPKQGDSKVEVTAHSKAESHITGEYKKEKMEETSVYSLILSSTKSETTNEDKAYQSHTQTEKSFANKDEQQSPNYSTSQSYKEVNSSSYGEQKKKVEASSLSYSKGESKPVIEHSKQNANQSTAEDKIKVSTYSASQGYKEVKSAKDIQHYKKQESAVYEQKPVDDSYTKHSVSYVDESQSSKPVSTPISYKKVESVLNSEQKQEHNEAEYGSSKSASVSAYDKYSSTSAIAQEPSKYRESNTKTYKSKSPSVSPAITSPVKEVTIYSKPASDESNRYNLPVYSTTTSFPTYQQSTGYTTTTKVSAISYEDKPKAYYTTTPKYEEYSTSVKAVMQNPPAYKSSVTYENTPVATISTRKEDYDDQYSSKTDTNIKTGASVPVEKYDAPPTTTANYNVQANDRVYVVADRDDIAETYQKKEQVSSYQSYPNPSVDEKLSSVKQVVNQYGSSDRSYSNVSSYTAKQSSDEGRPASSSAADLPAYYRKPIKEANTLTISVEGAHDSGKDGHDGVEGVYSAIPGKPEVDYPIFAELPNNKFNCSEQRLPGYYADTSARCQVFHICLGDRQWSFLCPNGTIFSQQHFVCVWWYEFDCTKAPALYELNEKLFVIPSTQQVSAYEGEQRTQPLASEISEETGKRYDTFSNKKATNSGAF